MILSNSNELTWRDVQYITLMTSRPDPIKDGQWITNGVGRKGMLYLLENVSIDVHMAVRLQNITLIMVCQRDSHPFASFPVSFIYMPKVPLHMFTFMLVHPRLHFWKQNDVVAKTGLLVRLHEKSNMSRLLETKNC